MAGHRKIRIYVLFSAKRTQSGNKQIQKAAVAFLGHMDTVAGKAIFGIAVGAVDLTSPIYIQIGEAEFNAELNERIAEIAQGCLFRMRIKAFPNRQGRDKKRAPFILLRQLGHGIANCAPPRCNVGRIRSPEQNLLALVVVAIPELTKISNGKINFSPFITVDKVVGR